VLAALVARAAPARAGGRHRHAMQRRPCSRIRPATTSRPARRRAGSATAIPRSPPTRPSRRWTATCARSRQRRVVADLLQAAALPDLAADSRFETNALRLANYESPAAPRCRVRDEAARRLGGLAARGRRACGAVRRWTKCSRIRKRPHARWC
jgi:hypothetical protein